VSINEANLVKVYGAQTEFGNQTANIIQHEIESLTHLVKDNPLKILTPSFLGKQK